MIIVYNESVRVKSHWSVDVGDINGLIPEPIYA